MEPLRKRVARKLGLGSPETLEKSSSSTFADLMGQREFEEDLPEAFDALRSAVSMAFYRPDGETRSPAELVAQSLDEFKEWATGELEDGGSATIKKFAQDIADADAIAERQDALANAYLRDHGSELVKSSATTSEEWDGSLERFDDEQLEASAVLDRGEEVEVAKERFALPVREPDGTVNTNALASAASHLAAGAEAVGEATEEQVAVAKRRLATVYKSAGIDPPDLLARFALVASDENGGSVESMDNEALAERIDKSLEKLPETIAKAVGEALATKPSADAGNGEDAPATAADLAKSIDDLRGDFDAKLDKLTDSVVALGDGGSGQSLVAKTEPEPETSTTKLAKSLEARELSPDLAGVL